MEVRSRETAFGEQLEHERIDRRITDPSGTALAGVTTSAEINATGRVVYGYNLRVALPGTYTITFMAPGITLSNPDDPEVDEHTISLDIDVTAGGGGGGGGHRP